MPTRVMAQGACPLTPTTDVPPLPSPGSSCPAPRCISHSVPAPPAPLRLQGSDGSYSRTRSSVEFSQYMRDNGYHIIPIASKHQLVGAQYTRRQAARLPLLWDFPSPTSVGHCLPACRSGAATAPTWAAARSLPTLKLPVLPCRALLVPIQAVTMMPMLHALQEYGCNCLNLGNERIISVHMETARQIVQSPHFFGDVQCIDYRWGFLF